MRNGNEANEVDEEEEVSAFYTVQLFSLLMWLFIVIVVVNIAAVADRCVSTRYVEDNHTVVHSSCMASLWNEYSFRGESTGSLSDCLSLHKYQYTFESRLLGASKAIFLKYNKINRIETEN